MTECPVELHVISDATGQTATQVVMAVEKQFPDLDTEVIQHPRITSTDDVQLAASRVCGGRAVVIYTLVDPAYREAMHTLCLRYKLHCCDLLGYPLEVVASVSGASAKGKPDARPVLDSSYFKRMDAIEFAVRSDDGLSTHRLTQADVVLVGVSRTSKTPLSIYLGYQGYKTANVPIVKGIAPPEELFDIGHAHLIGLTIQADRLAAIRGERVRNMRGGECGYAVLAEIYEELQYAEEIHRRLSCPVIDVSALSIEETAGRIIRLLEQRLLETDHSKERRRQSPESHESKT